MTDVQTLCLQCSKDMEESEDVDKRRQFFPAHKNIELFNTVIITNVVGRSCRDKCHFSLEN